MAVASRVHASPAFQPSVTARVLDSSRHAAVGVRPSRTMPRGSHLDGITCFSFRRVVHTSTVKHANRTTLSVRCEAASAVSSSSSSSKVAEVDIKTFDAAMEAAGSKLVVLDMYTQWCGPCKLLAPKIEALANTLQDVVFIKLDCNEENKPLAKSLGVRAVPTFKLFRDSKLLAEVQGAKYGALVDAIVTHQSGADAGRSSGALGPTLAPGQVMEVEKDTFYPALHKAGTKLVVLDMFTQWCGPCKLLAPKLDELAAANHDIVVLKLDCNEANKPLAKSLGIVSVPTVKLFRSYELLDEVRGAKFELLLELIEKHR